MEGVSSLFESAEKEKMDVKDLLKEETGKEKKAWTFAAKASQTERKTDISISSRLRRVK